MNMMIFSETGMSSFIQAGYGGQKKAEIAGKELERIALNEYGQKSWSLLSWFSPSNWASAPGGPSFCGGDGSPCADTVSFKSLNRTLFTKPDVDGPPDRWTVICWVAYL